jgi:hypothetical protein
MILVSCHAIGMLSSVKRALKHIEAHALPRHRIVAAVRSAIGTAMGLAAQQARPTATSRARGTVTPAATAGGIRGFGPLF